MIKQVEEKFKFGLRGKTLVIIDWSNVHGWSNSLNWAIDPQKLFNYLSSYPQIFDKRFYLGVDPDKKWSLELKEKVITIGFTPVAKEIKWVPVELNKLTYFKKLVKELFEALDNEKKTNSQIATKLYELRNKIELRLGVEEPDFNEAYELIEELDEELKKLNINIDNLQKNLSVPVLKRKCDFDVEITRDAFNLSDKFEQIILFSGDGDFAALAEDLIKKGKKVIVVFAPGHKGKEYEPLQEELKKNGKGYALFLCSVKRLKQEFSVENSIPPDFSGGRDKESLADIKLKSQALDGG